MKRVLENVDYFGESLAVDVLFNFEVDLILFLLDLILEFVLILEKLLNAFFLCSLVAYPLFYDAFFLLLFFLRDGVGKFEDWFFLLLKEAGSQVLAVGVDEAEHGWGLLIIRVVVLRLELIMHPITDHLPKHDASFGHGVVFIPLPTRELHTKSKNLLENFFHPIFLLQDIFHEVFHSLFDLLVGELYQT